jgi:hypothetical protein
LSKPRRISGCVAKMRRKTKSFFESANAMPTRLAGARGRKPNASRGKSGERSVARYHGMGLRCLPSSADDEARGTGADSGSAVCHRSGRDEAPPPGTRKPGAKADFRGLPYGQCGQRIVSQWARGDELWSIRKWEALKQNRRIWHDRPAAALSRRWSDQYWMRSTGGGIAGASEFVGLRGVVVTDDDSSQPRHVDPPPRLSCGFQRCFDARELPASSLGGVELMPALPIAFAAGKDQELSNVWACYDPPSAHPIASGALARAFRHPGLLRGSRFPSRTPYGRTRATRTLRASNSREKLRNSIAWPRGSSRRGVASSQDWTTGSNAW